MYRRGILLLSTLFTILSVPAEGQVAPTAADRTGTVRGSVVDRETFAPISNVLVAVVGLPHEALSDAEGRFVLGPLPVGSYSIRLERIGYASALRADVVVKSDRITFVNVELESAAVGIEGLVVGSGYFPSPAERTTSNASFQTE
ncbi:MAG: carboxypeptidase-like regulatory domain-containing protein, partial [Planctomycetota bacterium]